MAAEKNTNPFAVSVPSLCSDVNLPATPELRGIIPLVDPDTVGADIQNANSASSLANPFPADGLSVADISEANGFSNFTRQGSDGSTEDATGGGNAGNGDGEGNGNDNGNANNGGNAGNNGGAATTSSAIVGCGGVRTLTTVVVPPTAIATPETGNDNDNNNNNNNGGGRQQSSIPGLDFGSCVPTMKFVGGLNGRPADEFTFQAIDEQIAANQQEALNPNIITNRICDELTNICGANQAAKDACADARARIEALGTRDASTAETWNGLLGFAGTDVSGN